MRTIGGLGLTLLLGCGSQGGAADGDQDSAGTDLGGSSTAAANTTGSGIDESGGSSTTAAADDSTGDETGPAQECEVTVPPGDHVVTTTRGAVAGAEADGVIEFWGIPYAAPPVDDLRWQPPQPAACWPDVHVADTPGSRCAQLDTVDGPVVGGEDCLYLNVWTPEATADQARPVMVFIHGGGHAIGSGTEPIYRGANLAREYGVVIVTINYRLGALGYLAHASLDAEDPRGVSGNYGLLDQLFALRWVADNIAAFGGDPGRVTVFGQSAGGASTCTVLGAPEAAGLVHGAIVQSGGCGHRSSEVYREQMGDPWIEGSPCATDDDVAGCLRALSFDEVIAAEPTGFPSASVLGQGWSAYVDGVTLPATTLAQMEAGEHIDVPFVVGANAEETANEVSPLDQEAYEARVSAAFGPLSPQVLAQYPVADYPTPTDAWIALSSDLQFVCSARASAEAAATGGRSPVFRYHLSYDGYTTGPMGDAAASHGLELRYLFANFDTLLGGSPYVPNADDLAMAAQLGEAWTTFARTGDPNTATLTWPVYEAGVDPYTGLDVPPSTGEGVRTPQCDFWAGLLGG